MTFPLDGRGVPKASFWKQFSRLNGDRNNGLIEKFLFFELPSAKEAKRV